MDHPSQSLTWPTAVFRDRAGTSVGNFVRAVWSRVRSFDRRLRAAAGRQADCEIPDGLRDDAGLARREPPRRVEWWELRP